VVKDKIGRPSGKIQFSIANTKMSIFWVFIGAKENRGGIENCSYKTCKAPAKFSPPTSQHTAFYRPDALPVT